MSKLSQEAGVITVIIVFVLICSITLLCIYELVEVWPPDCQGGDNCSTMSAKLFRWPGSQNRAHNLLIIVALAGALGGLVHVATSFADYIGNRQLVFSWIWWLFLQVPVSMALAIVFYLLIRGGLMMTPSGNSADSQVNPYGIAGLSTVVGMFSKQATDKLSEVFTTLFKSDKNKQRSEPLSADGKPGIDRL